MDRAKRLMAARLALHRAEERTGVRGAPDRQVQQSLAGALEKTGPRGALPLSSPSDPWLGVDAGTSGALSLDGSTAVTVLVALAARRQGARSWCGVVGHDDLGWCAASEAGLDLSRVLVVSVQDLDAGTIRAVIATLLDGVDVLLIGRPAAACLRPRDRRALLARARGRGALIVTTAPWEGARVLRAEPRGLDDGRAPDPVAPLSAAGTAADSKGRGARGPAGGVVIPLHHSNHSAPRRPPAHPPEQAAVEMPAGYLRALSWSLGEEARPASELLLDARGVRIQASADGDCSNCNSGHREREGSRPGAPARAPALEAQRGAG